jgi:hypothetical protein
MSPRRTPALPAVTAAVALAGLIAAPLAADDDRSIGLTIYSSADPRGFDPQQFIAQQRQGHQPNFAWQVPGFGVVRETRRVEFEEGVNRLNFVDVARFIDPTTVTFLDLDDAAASTVLEQTFLFDLVSPEKLLDNYLDQEITVRVPTQTAVEEFTGVLLSSVQNQLVLQTADGIRMVPRHGTQVMLGQMPGGLITKPTLQWLVAARQAGERAVRTSYQTNGITWRADYNLILNEDDTLADLGAWVTVLNLSGKAYPNTELKLIAGDVQRIQPQPPHAPMMRMRAAQADMMMAEQAGFEQQAFFEYHLYTLPRRADIADNTTQQLVLFPTAAGVEVEKVLVYYGLPEAQNWGPFPRPQLDRDFGNQSNKKVDVYIRFENREENNLGIPLPAGKVRVFKAPPGNNGAAGGALEFVGEDLIDHTPRDEKVLIKTGQAFDVVGERTQTNFTRDEGRRTMTESFRIQVRNHKDIDEKVVIKENLFRWLQWEITDASDEFEKIDARTIHFEVDVPARDEKTVEYTVRYQW